MACASRFLLQDKTFPLSRGPQTMSDDFWGEPEKHDSKYVILLLQI